MTTRKKETENDPISDSPSRRTLRFSLPRPPSEENAERQQRERGDEKPVRQVAATRGGMVRAREDFQRLRIESSVGDGCNLARQRLIRFCAENLAGGAEGGCR